MSTLRAACLMAFLLLAAALVSAAAPARAAAHRCDLSGKERKLGPTYTTSLKTKKVSCRKGRRVVKAYYKCRVRHGGKDGKCHSRVKRFRCHEKRSNVISTQYDARVKCRRGRKRVVHTYTQFT